MVWQYGDFGPQPPYLDSTGYGQKWTQGAVECGFTLLGWAPDPRIPHYQQAYALLISADRDCLAVVCTGHIFKLPSQSATIYTATTSGQVYYTTQNLNGMQIDRLRHWMSQLAPTTHFSGLLERHHDLLRVKNATVRPFTAGRELEEFKQMRAERYQNMARRGLIVYTDPMETCWHFTMWGSLRYTFLNYTIGLVRAKTNGRVFRCV